MCNSFFYLRGGADRCFLDLSNLLTTQGHEVIPFCMQHERNYPSIYSDYFVSFIDFPSLLNTKTSIQTKYNVARRVIYNQEAKSNISQLIKDTNPDIAHIHGFGHELSPSILDAIKQFNIPIVSTLHDYGLLCPNTSFISKGEVCEKCKIHRYYNVVLHKCKRNSFSASLLAGIEKSYHSATRIIQKNVDVFISPSVFLKQKMLEYNNSIETIHIPNFVDVEQIRPSYSTGDYFLFFGRLTAIKGLNTLVEAMKSITFAKLRIAGDGELRESLEDYIKEYRLDNIEILGHLETTKLVNLIQDSSFVVVPSEWYENYPMAIIEAFSCGKPVIASRIGAIPDIVQDGYNGLLFEPRNVRQLIDKIQFMHDNPQITKEMGMNARKQVEKINNSQTHYLQTMNVYKSLIHK